jgi:hypothetical protein
MRSCKRYHWCRFMLKSYRGDRLEYASLMRIKDRGCVDISPNLGSCIHSTLYGQGIG